jgi:hypothetical protein
VKTVNSEKGDVASPVTVLIYCHKDIGRFDAFIRALASLSVSVDY